MKKQTPINKVIASPTLSGIGKKFDERVHEEFIGYGWDPILDIVNDFYRKEILDILDYLEQLITAEILIAQKENKPTSRLTSLAVKVGEMKK